MIVNANVLTVVEASINGRCDVPSEAIAAYKAIGRFREARRSAQVGTATATTNVEVPIDAVLQALAQGTKLDDAYWEKLYTQMQEGEKRRSIAQLLDLAEVEAKRTVESVVESQLDGIIASLAPRLEQLLDEARAVVAELGDTPRTEAAVMRASDNRVRKAWLKLDGELGERYAAMRSLYLVMLAVQGGVLGPQAQTFGVVRDVPAVWEDWATTAVSEVPWPSDPGRLILWAIDRGVALHFPTPRQLEQAITDAAAQRRDEQFADIGGSAS